MFVAFAPPLYDPNANYRNARPYLKVVRTSPRTRALVSHTLKSGFGEIRLVPVRMVDWRMLL